MIHYHPIIQHLTGNMDLLRLDLIDKKISGNKWFKLKNNLEKAEAGNFETIVTFGGAFSNHIAATAAACKKSHLKCVGIIRGEESSALNPTLAKAKQDGMQLHFVSREFYSQILKDGSEKYLHDNFGRHYLIPEGGNNEEGVLGCMEILKKEWDYDYIFCACGTGTTFAGLVASAKPGQKVIGISVLKGENKLPLEVQNLLGSISPGQKNKIQGNEAPEKSWLEDHCILNTYCFNGYAKFDENLLQFKNDFELKHKISLDHIYTSKLLYGVFDLNEKNKLKPGSKILIVHSGGLQGNKGFEERYHLTPSL
jgi:1-aminocyclopropane-1-carboxylate deaminase